VTSPSNRLGPQRLGIALAALLGAASPSFGQSAVAPAVATPAPRPGAEAALATRAVAQAANRFYKALNQMFAGDILMMKGVWSHAEDVTYMGPGGDFLTGWPAVLAELERQTKLKLGGTVNAAEMRITVGRDLAVVSNYERGQNTNAAGKTAAVSLRATSVFRKEGGLWKMIGHHTDTLPYLQQ
jgi:ketosteroid isomerase-like protein